MGNKIAKTTQVSASEYYLHDLPSSYNLVYIESLGHDRLFKSIRCKHDEGEVLVKVYFKRGDSVALKEHEKRLSEFREILLRVQRSHVWPFQFWLETDKAAYLLRQYFFSNLHDRLSTRPFLSHMEKKWLAFQLLYAVKQSHENGICHGDIKCENVLVTSWNWLFLADFASFKPTYIPVDDPSDFSFFFHTGGRRRCYLAPERFYENGSEMQAALDAPLKPSMDIFSLGSVKRAEVLKFWCPTPPNGQTIDLSKDITWSKRCAIAELFLDGQPLFEYSQLLAYRRGQYDPCQHLEKITDTGIRKMILHMIQLDPELRLSCESYLQEYSSVLFPSFFSPFLHKFFSCLVPLDSDRRVLVIQSAFHEIHRQIVGPLSSESTAAMNLTSGEPDYQRIRREETMAWAPPQPNSSEIRKDSLITKVSSLFKEGEQGKVSSTSSSTLEETSTDLDNVRIYDASEKLKHQSPGEVLKTISNEYIEKVFPLLRKIQKSDLKLLLSEYDSELDMYMYSLFPERKSNLGSEGMVLISALICSCLRSVRQPQVRRHALLMLLDSSLYIDDEDRLQHVLPHVVAMLSDTSAIVRCAALETLSNILPLIINFPPSDVKIFPEYILPMLSMLPHDQEESVRICYAGNIFKIALSAYRFLICPQMLNEFQSSEKVSLLSNKRKDAVHAQIFQLRRSIAEVLQELVMGPKQTPNIRRALLQDIGQLCYFFGQRQSNDFLLPILPAFLNDRDEQLRPVFYDHIVFVCFFVGQRSVEEYLLPYIEQGLSDGMEAVIVNTLQCLTMLCKNEFLRKSILLDVIEKSFPLLCYPSRWVKRSIVGFIAACCESLGPVDSHVYLSPVLRPFLHREPNSLSSEESLLSCLKPPVSKSVYYQVLESARSSDMLERQRKIWYNASPSLKQQEGTDSFNEVAKDQNTRKKESIIQDKKHLSVVKTRGSFSVHNFSSPVDGRDSISSEKMQFSGFISPQVSTGNSLVSDGQSEGIPVYSVTTETLLMRNSSAIASQSSAMVGPSNRQFSMSSSGPSKLVSGPKRVKLPPENEDKDADQSGYITSKFRDITVSDTPNYSSSVAEEESSPQTDSAGLPAFSRGSSILDEDWKPRGVLVAHLQEHHCAVNDISVSVDHSFFVTVSDDSTVKIWDTRRLEKDISFRSRLTYPLDGNGNRGLCTSMVNGGAQVAVGTCTGAIHIFSIDHVPKGPGSTVERYSGIAYIKKEDDSGGAVISLLNPSVYDGSRSQTLLYSTHSGGVHLWDTRTNSETWRFKCPQNEGYVSSLAIGMCGNWFVSGTSRGVVTLWDMRFLLPVNSWKYFTECPVEDMCLCITPANSSVSSSSRPLIYVAAGCNEVSLWSVENGSCHQVLRSSGGDSDVENSSSVPWALRKSVEKSSMKQRRELSNVDSNYRIEEFNKPPSRLPGVRSLLPLPSGCLLTGGTDMKIRYWDHLSPSKSYAICGPSVKGMVYNEKYETRSYSGVQLVQETIKLQSEVKLNQKALLAVAATDTAGCHQDVVLSMAAVKMNQRLLISGGRDGAIKVWK